MREMNGGVATKVCGVMQTDDALFCATEGVEMIGLNFSAQSVRCLTPTTAGEIIAALRARFAGTEFVGVFVNQALEEVKAIARDLELDAIQLHGEESPEYVRNWDASYVIKALRVGPAYSDAMAAEYECEAILLDSWNPTTPGGTGETFPWSVATSLRPRVDRLILAGGLTEENVGDAIRTVRPFAVDVCSGVEDVPGRKNHAKLRRFVQAVRAAQGIPA